MGRSLLENRLLRIVLPLAVLAIWFGIAGAGGPAFGRIAKVESNSQASFLPANADSTRVQAQLPHYVSSSAIPAVILLTHVSVQSASDRERIAQIPAVLTASERAGLDGKIVGPIWSRSGMAAEFLVPVRSSAAVNTVVDHMRTVLSSHLGSEVHVYVTGPAGLTADLISAFGGIDGILLLVALITVFVILLLVYRSVILPIMVLLLDMVALSGAILVVYALAAHGTIELNGQAQGILSILVIGAATDYSLLIISRHREALQHEQASWKALIRAVRSAAAPITASAVTVILALLCLLFSNLRSNQSLGPVAAIGVGCAYCASMSFLPALLLLLGRSAFWPYRPRYSPRDVDGGKRQKGLWAAVASRVERAPRLIWMLSTGVLLVAALGLTQLRAQGVSNAATIRTASNAVDGQRLLGSYFPAGAGSPVDVIAPLSTVPSTLATVDEVLGNHSAAVYTGSPIPGAGQPVIRDGRVLITATLSEDPTSSHALSIIRELRSKLSTTAPGALVGGETATALDTNATAQQDLHRIIPIVLAVVVVILAVLLRALLAPVLLIISVVLSYSATLGFSALLFNNVFRYPGADPSVPLFGFIFLVALGIDYNIFLMSRVR